jgi:hypothetical protein
MRVKDSSHWLRGTARGYLARADSMSVHFQPPPSQESMQALGECRRRSSGSTGFRDKEILQGE